MYDFVRCNEIILKELKDNNEITGFKLGCSRDDSVTETICVKTDEDNIVAILDYNIEDDEVEIGEFEVLSSLRHKGIGKDVIMNFQNKIGLKAINLYPADEGAKMFWAKCGFFDCYDGLGTMMMRWESDI